MRFIATYSKWGNLFIGRFYINGQRVKEYQFDVRLNSFMKSGASFTRKLDNMSPVKYRITWERA